MNVFNFLILHLDEILITNRVFNRLRFDFFQLVEDRFALPDLLFLLNIIVKLPFLVQDLLAKGIGGLDPGLSEDELVLLDIRMLVQFEP